jgi:predicted N-acetyltransferase YhbS
MPTLRLATTNDIAEIVRLTNEAFQAEAFCVSGDRTDDEDIAARLSTGVFFVVDHEVQAQRLIASVYAAMVNGRGYLGLIAVAPSHQGLGLSPALVERVEEHVRAAGAQFLDITVVNVRRDLFGYYAKFGFAPCDVLPFPVPERAREPLQLIKMTKPLAPPWALAMRPTERA